MRRFREGIVRKLYTGFAGDEHCLVSPGEDYQVSMVVMDIVLCKGCRSSLNR